MFSRTSCSKQMSFLMLEDSRNFDGMLRVDIFLSLFFCWIAFTTCTALSHHSCFLCFSFNELWLVSCSSLLLLFFLSENYEFLSELLAEIEKDDASLVSSCLFLCLPCVLKGGLTLSISLLICQVERINRANNRQVSFFDKKKTMPSNDLLQEAIFSRPQSTQMWRKARCLYRGHVLTIMTVGGVTQRWVGAKAQRWLKMEFAVFEA